MVLSYAKDCWNFTRHAVLYTRSSIAFGAKVRKTVVGEDVSIGKSLVYGSQLSDRVHIGSSCVVVNSLFEEQVLINSACSIVDSSLGRFTYTGLNSLLNCTSVGRFCSIGPYIMCGIGEHPVSFPSTHPVFFSTLKQCGTSFVEENLFDEVKPVLIGNDVWIGAKVFIRNGVTINDGAIIGAGAVVVKDVPAYSIVGGVPAKVIRFRFPENLIQGLQLIQWWNWTEEELKVAQPYFCSNNINAFIEFAQNHAIEQRNEKFSDLQ
jgi:acetyltransferase-like isoleucine patch superfamily enzyme